MNHLLRTRDLSVDFVEKVVRWAESFKRRPLEKNPLDRRSLGLLFEKSSTRTRVSLEVAMVELGGHATYLPKHDLQIGRGESVDHTARVLSSYLHGIAMRTGSHETVETFASSSSAPVINALSDEAHPCQSLADLLTLKEVFPNLSDVELAWVGDGNNVANSVIEAAALAGIRLRVATPAGYEPDPSSINFAEERTEVVLTGDPAEAVEDADAVYTDVWVSMGDEEERGKRTRDFEGFSVTSRLLEGAPGAKVMHCMPIQGPEIEEKLVHSDRSLVFQQAENRLHASKAILEYLIS
ncbi:MAG: Ornithine carbamoyltransferase, anabolic [Methanonatronarchaeales archaeon]|nr:Ornithine carbamoyltransferase, anabolic [Methanonatronarchaeales archaeon]